jgi:hypothetical protein
MKPVFIAVNIVMYVLLVVVIAVFLALNNSGSTSTGCGGSNATNAPDIVSKYVLSCHANRLPATHARSLIESTSAWLPPLLWRSVWSLSSTA